MIAHYPKITKLLLAIIDVLLIVVSFILAAYLRNASLKISPFGAVIDWKNYWDILFAIVIVWQSLLNYQEAYSNRRFYSLKENIYIMFKTIFIGTLIILTFAFLIKSKLPRTQVFFFAVVNLVLLVEVRVHLHQFMSYRQKKTAIFKNVLVLGTGDVAKTFIDSIRKYPDWSVKILGLIGKDESELGEERLGYKIIGHVHDIRELLHRSQIDELIIALPAKWLSTVDEVMSICDEEGVQVRIISPFFKNLISTAKVDMIHDLPVITFSSVYRDDFDMALKRIMDISISLSLLILLSPLFLVISILVKYDSKGPVFYRWKVLGLNKRYMTSYKFRTMVETADDFKKELEAQNEMNGAAFKMQKDPRVTQIGRWLRKYSLDELPQLWSVLQGDMSLVGPRPPLQTEIDKFDHWQRRKLSVKPGITCLWQVRGRNEISDFNEWMRLDMEYIDNWSLWLDIKILFMTIFVVLSGTGQ